MAMFPALLNDSIFSDLFDDPFFNGFRGLRSGATSDTDGHVAMTNLMSTDVKEHDKDYEVAIDLPGFAKDDINVELSKGYLTVSAHRDEKHDDKDQSGKWLRRERYTGTCSRSFYVGNGVKDSDIHAKFQDGTLHLQLPKVDAAQVENASKIEIEG